MKSILIAGVALALTGGHVFAAEFAVKAPRPIVDTWTGIYVGGHADWIRSRWNETDNIVCLVAACTPILVAIEDLNRIFASDSFSKSGFGGGLTAGFNWKLGSFAVAGVEVDYTWFNHADNRVFAGNFYTAFPTESQTIVDSASAKDLFTLRGRAGWLINNTVLVYATGGLARTRVNYTHSFRGFGGNGVAGGLSAFEDSSNSKVLFGWVAGGGLEYAVGQWSLKAEYLYAAFDSVIYSGSLQAVDATGFPIGNPYVWYHSKDINIQVARLGINYRFAVPAPVVAKY